MVKLGDKVKDNISGLEGIVTGRSEYLYGCAHILVNPQQVKDGAPVAGTWLDEDRFTVIEEGVIPRPAAAEVKRGGPAMSTPPSGNR